MVEATSRRLQNNWQTVKQYISSARALLARSHSLDRQKLLYSVHKRVVKEEGRDTASTLRFMLRIVARSTSASRLNTRRIAVSIVVPTVIDRDWSKYLDKLG
jgi:hypothetical protein